MAVLFRPVIMAFFLFASCPSFAGILSQTVTAAGIKTKVALSNVANSAMTATAGAATKTAKLTESLTATILGKSVPLTANNTVGSSAIASAAVQFFLSKGPNPYVALGVLGIGVGTQLYDWYQAAGFNYDTATGQVKVPGTFNPSTGGYEGGSEWAACSAQRDSSFPIGPGTEYNANYICKYHSYAECPMYAGTYGQIKLQHITHTCEHYNFWQLGYPAPPTPDEIKSDQDAAARLATYTPDNPADAVNQMVANGTKPTTSQDDTVAGAPSSVSIPESTTTTTYPDGTVETKTEAIESTVSGDEVTSQRKTTTVSTAPNGGTSTLVTTSNTASPATTAPATETTADPCATNPDSLGCIGLGSATPEMIPTVEAPSTFSWSSWGSGSCPAPVTVRPGVVFDYSSYCDKLALLRPVVVAIAFLIAGFILMGPIKE